MAHWAEHYIMDGVAGVLPDISLACAVIIRRGRRVEYDSVGFRWHRYLHSYRFLLFLIACIVIFHSRLSSILMRHIVLDYLTHDRNWLRHGHTEFYCQQ